jgi:hypothetical protein
MWRCRQAARRAPFLAIRSSSAEIQKFSIWRLVLRHYRHRHSPPSSCKAPRSGVVQGTIPKRSSCKVNWGPWPRLTVRRRRR